MSHFFPKQLEIISSQCMLYFFLEIVIIFSTDLKFLKIGFADGPMTKVNFALGFFLLKDLITPVDRIVSPIRFDEITRIFTEMLHFYIIQYIFSKL